MIPAARSRSPVARRLPSVACRLRMGRPSRALVRPPAHRRFAAFRCRFSSHRAARRVRRL